MGSSEDPCSNYTLLAEVVRLECRTSLFSISYELVRLHSPSGEVG